MGVLEFYYRLSYFTLLLDQDPLIHVEPEGEVISLVRETQSSGHSREFRPLHGLAGREAVLRDTAPGSLQGLLAVTDDRNRLVSLSHSFTASVPLGYSLSSQFRYGQGNRLDSSWGFDGTGSLASVAAYFRDARGLVDSTTGLQWNHLRDRWVSSGSRIRRDSLGRVVESRSSDVTAGSLTFSYDKEGRLAERRLTSLLLVAVDSLFYDDRGRWIRVDHWSPSRWLRSTHFEYQPLARVTGLSARQGFGHRTGKSSRPPGYFRYSGRDILGRRPPLR